MKQQFITKLLAGVAGLGIALGAVSAYASPEKDRQELIHYFTTKYPNIKIEDYVYGALAFDEDSKAQYDAIMEFPPFESDIEKGRKMWETPFKNGKTYASCLPNGGKNIAGNYPMFDEAKGKVVTLQDAINDCRVANGEEAYKLNDMKTMGTLTAYMRTLSDGMLMNVKVAGPKALAAYEDGVLLAQGPAQLRLRQLPRAECRQPPAVGGHLAQHRPGGSLAGVPRRRHAGDPAAAL